VEIVDVISRDKAFDRVVVNAAVVKAVVLVGVLEGEDVSPRIPKRKTK
jgi:hypothetical protein